MGTIETAPTQGLGERVRTARRERGMSQAQLAGEELTKGFISQVESGLVRPSVRSLQIIANRLSKSLDYFLGDVPLATEKRLAFHRLAAEAAAERQDWDVVRSEVASGLECAPPRRDRAALLRLLAQAELAGSQREPAFDRMNEALSLLEVATDADEVARLQHLRGIAYGQINQYLAAAEALEQARDTMERHEVNDPRLRARILVALGTVYRRLNRTAKAMQTYASALDLASASSELRVAAQGYMGVAVSFYDAGELDSAIHNYRRALDLFERVEDRSFELSVMHSLATIHFERGAIDEARELATRSLGLAKMSGDARVEAAAQVVLARIALGDGDATTALELAKNAEKTLSMDRVQRADALRVLGAAHDTLGAHAASDRAYRKSIELLSEIDDRPDRSAIAAEYAQKLRARGDVDAAFHFLELARGR
ncbi:MAG TPA: tetratricopeptide repeat protein [Candidatus Limnocylindrales bacterium]|nr:tetratricopeptide repeat protein [Candidatus Limnocylindrales bacterium]